MEEESKREKVKSTGKQPRVKIEKQVKISRKLTSKSKVSGQAEEKDGNTSSEKRTEKSKSSENKTTDSKKKYYYTTKNQNK